MPTRAKSPTTETPPDSASMTSTPISKATRKTTRKQKQSATAASAPTSKKTTCKDRSQFMQERFPDANIVTDVGGGLNFQRKGLVSLLERLHRGDKLRIVVAHRDRLARFGFELIQWMAEQNGGEILVLDNTGSQPPAGTHRGYSRHPPYLQLPAPRTPPLPKPNREGYDSIPQRSRNRY